MNTIDNYLNQLPLGIYEKISKIWNEFKTEIVEQNRYFSGVNVIQILSQLNFMPIFPNGTKLQFFRARIGDYCGCQDTEMLAPPIRKASYGRCNPEGISYLYLANQKETALSEVRPQIGDTVTIITCDVDISKVFTFNVYLMEQYGIKAANDEVKCLLLLILKDLQSVVTISNHLDYIPLQYIAEYIKSLGYHGFMYSSIYGNGMNLVMFDWNNKVKIKTKEKVYINNSKLIYSTL